MPFLRRAGRLPGVLYRVVAVALLAPLLSIATSSAYNAQAAPDWAQDAALDHIVAPPPDEPDDERPRLAQPRNVTSLVPARLLETRTVASAETVDGQFESTGLVDAGETVELTVTDRGGVPADAAAVMLNVTAVSPQGRGFLTVFPCGEDRPLASNVNYVAGGAVPNAVLAKVGRGGAVCVFTRTATHVVVDVNGFVGAESGTVPLVPARLLETRAGLETIDDLFAGDGIVESGETLELTVAGRGGVPQNASAAVLNVTAVNPSGRGFLTVFPCGEEQPLASNLNYVTGDVVANAALAKIGSNGKVCIFTNSPTDIVVDVNAYVTADTGTTPLTPARVLETRPSAGGTIDGEFQGAGRLSDADTIEVQISNRGGVPDTGVGAVMLNVTAIAPDGSGFLTVFPCGQDRPLASNVNYAAGDVVPNAVLARLGEGGKVCVYTETDTHLAIDVNGWFDLPPNQLDTDVMVLDQEEDTFQFESISGGDGELGGNVSFDTGSIVDPEVARVTTSSPMFEEGEKVVLTRGQEGEPYYGEVQSVEGNSALLSEVALADVLPTMDVSLETDMEGNVTTIVGGDAVTNVEVATNTKASGEGSPSSFSGSCTAGAGLDVTATATADVGKFVFDVSFNIFDGLTAAKIGFNPTLTATATATVSAAASCQAEKVLFTKQLPTIKFVVGAVPVWIKHEIDVSVKAAVEAKASGSITLGATASAFAGIVYRNGQWDRETSLNFDFIREVGTDVEISATLSAPVLTYKARAYGVAGFDADVAANLRLTFRPLAKKYLTLTFFVDFGVSLVVELDLVVTSLHWEHDFPRIMIFTKEVWSDQRAATNCNPIIPFSSGISESECEALLDLWATTGGPQTDESPGWVNSPNWGEQIDPCTWNGVTCAESGPNRGSVTRLDLDQTRMSGPIPASFGNLVHLEEAIFGGFQTPNFVESLPDTIADLDKLRVFDLADTGLNAVPSAIGGMAALERLDLSYNAVTSLPPEIGDLAQLKALVLDENPIEVLPRQVGKLANLVDFSLRQPGDPAIPTDSIIGLFHLTPEFSDLASLESLIVTRNPELTAIPDVSQMTGMRFMVLRDTGVTELPSGMENLTSLEVLATDGAPIESLPVGIGVSDKLFQLEMRRTNVDGDITEALRTLMQNSPNVTIWFTSSRCPVITDAAVQTWFEGQLVDNFEGPGFTHQRWDANCPK